MASRSWPTSSRRRSPTPTSKIVDDNDLRLAREPKVELSTDQQEIEAALEARGDLKFKVALEVLPMFEIGDFSADRARARDRRRRRGGRGREPFSVSPTAGANYADRAEGAAAETGDRVTVDFVGTINGEPFEGGAGKDIEVVLGSNTFIPGFEEQLAGATAGEKRVVQATFPETYARAQSRRQDGGFRRDGQGGRRARGARDRRRVRQGPRLRSPRRAAGADPRADRRRLRPRLARQDQAHSCSTALDARYSFELPEGLVEQEFDSIWTQVEREQQGSGRSFADENTTEEAARADYRKIAERRVRLGLLLAEVGAKADVKVTDEEMTQALIARARAFPGQEKEVWDFYRNNQNALAELRAPIYEEKVVDHILGRRQGRGAEGDARKNS